MELAFDGLQFDLQMEAALPIPESEAATRILSVLGYTMHITYRCMCVYIYMYLYMCMYVHMHMHMYMYMYMYVYMHMSYVYVNVNVYVFILICACMHGWMDGWMDGWVYVCTCTCNRFSYFPMYVFRFFMCIYMRFVYLML